MPDNIISLIRPLDDWILKARGAMEDGDFLTATKFYRKALSLRRHSVILLEMAYAYFSLHSYETVEHLIWDNLTTYPLDGEWCYLAALNAVNRGDHDLSQDALKAYLFMDPEGDHAKSAVKMLTSFPWKKLVPPAYGARAYTLFRRYGQDKNLMCHAARRDPGGRCDVRCARLFAKEEAETALLHVHAALEKGVPRDMLPEMHIACFIAYHRLGHTAESRVAWEKAGAACVEMDSIEDMVRAAMDEGLFDWAEELVDAWLEQMPCAAHLLRLKILLFDRQGKQKESGAVKNQLTAIDPFHPLRYSTPEETEQTILSKRSMISERIRALVLTAEEGD